jgi:hypothetical protein
MICVINYIVINLCLLVMNYIVHLNEYMYILPVLEAPWPGRQPKQAVVIKQNNYICRFPHEYNGPRINHGLPPGPSIFIG